MPGVNGKDILARLEAQDWTLDRVSGSHRIMVKNGKAVPVPVHGTRDVGTGLLWAPACCRPLHARPASI